MNYYQFNHLELCLTNKDILFVEMVKYLEVNIERQKQNLMRYKNIELKLCTIIGLILITLDYFTENRRVEG